MFRRILPLVLVAAVIFMEQGQRRIPVQYAKRVVGRRMYGGSSTHIPLKVNTGGVIPVIFASSMLYLPVLYAQFQPGTAESPNPVSNWIATNLTTGSWAYELLFFAMIIFFAFSIPISAMNSRVTRGRVPVSVGIGSSMTSPALSGPVMQATQSGCPPARYGNRRSSTRGTPSHMFCTVGLR